MAGQFIHYEDGAHISRYLHVRGHLGFHVPSLQVPPGSYNSETVDNSFRSAMASIADILVLARRGSTISVGASDRIRQSLLEQMLRTDSASIYMIRTTGQASRWGIGLVGWKPPNDITTDVRLDALCGNFLAARADEDPPASDHVALFVKRERRHDSAGRGEATVASVNQGGYFEKGCDIELPEGSDHSASLRIKGNDGFSGFSGTDFIPSWYGFPASTPLPSLYDATATSLNATAIAPLQAHEGAHAEFSGDLMGGDLRRIKNSNRQDCEAACKVEKDCRAWSFDRWNRWCFLKASVGELRIDPQSVSGVKAGFGRPVRSVAPIVMQRYRGRAFPASEGEAIAPAASFEACEKRCEASGSCVAVSFNKATRQCRLIIDAGEYRSDLSTDSSVKRQAESR